MCQHSRLDSKPARMLCYANYYNNEIDSGKLKNKIIVSSPI